MSQIGVPSQAPLFRVLLLTLVRREQMTFLDSPGSS
jgi:hypothetical protein